MLILCSFNLFSHSFPMILYYPYILFSVLHIFSSSRLEYPHNLALTPANVQKLGLMKVPEETVIAYHARKTESASKRPSTKKDADCDSNSCCFDPEDAFSDTTFSTLSGECPVPFFFPVKWSLALFLVCGPIDSSNNIKCLHAIVYKYSKYL